MFVGPTLHAGSVLFLSFFRPQFWLECTKKAWLFCCALCNSTQLSVGADNSYWLCVGVGAVCAACIWHQKSLVIIVSLSQPTVELEQQFKKFLKDCIKINLFIVYQRPAI